MSTISSAYSNVEIVNKQEAPPADRWNSRPKLNNYCSAAA
jgi:hypothetical protein